MPAVLNRPLLPLVFGLLALIALTGLACESIDYSCEDRNWSRDRVFAMLDDGVGATDKGEDGRTLLHAAATCSDDPAAIRVLLNRGADIHARSDFFGVTPLHEAARYNEEPSVIALLLDRGADIHAKTDSGGDTPLHYAARSNEQSSVIKTLLN